MMATFTVAADFQAWLFCRQCEEAEVLRPSGPDLLPPTERRDSVVSFLEQHAGHTVTQLVPTGPGATLYSGPLWDPHTVLWIEVTDGHVSFVLEGFRSRIDAPRRYRLRRGALLCKTVFLEFDRGLARLAWNHSFGATGKHSEGELLVDRAQKLIAQIDPETVEPEFDDSNDPETAFAAWPPAAREAIRTQGRLVLPRALHRQWDAFVREHCNSYGAWALRVRTRVQLAGAATRLNAPL